MFGRAWRVDPGRVRGRNELDGRQVALPLQLRFSGPDALLSFAEGERVNGASIEATLELWASSLRDAKARIRPLFTQDRVAASAGGFLDGLLGPERRKTGWMRGEATGDPGPWRQEGILGRGRSEAGGVRGTGRAAWRARGVVSGVC